MPIDPLATNQVEVIRGPGGAALRLDVDRRRRQRDQQPHPGRAALLRGRAVPELRAAGQGAAGERAISVLRERRDPHAPSVRSTAASKAASCSMPAAAISRSTPTPMAARPATTASRAIRICSTRRGRSTAASRIRRCRPTARRSAAPTSSRAASSARRSRRTTRSIASPASTAPITRPGSTPIRPSSPPRANTGRMRRRSTPSGSGPAPPTTSTTRSASPIPPIPRRDGVRQTFTNKEQEGRLEVQMMPFNARFAAVTTAFGLQAGHQELTAPSPDDPGSPLNGLWDPNNNTQRRRLRLQRVQVHATTTKAQIAGRIEHVESQRHDAGIHSRTVRPQRQSRRHRPAIAAQPELHAEERQRRPDPEPAVRSGRQHHRAICRARAEAGRAVFARRDTTRPRTFDIGNPNLGIETAKSIEVGLRRGDRAVPVRSDRLLHQVQRLHLTAG